MNRLPLRSWTLAPLLVSIALAAVAFSAAPASAAPSAWWHVTSHMVPSNLAPGAEGKLVVQAVNVGNETTAGELNFSDVLPAGVTLQSVSLFSSELGNGTFDVGPSSFFGGIELCHTTSGSVTCSSKDNAEEEFLAPLLPFGYLEMRLTIKAEAGAATAANKVQMS